MIRKREIRLLPFKAKLNHLSSFRWGPGKLPSNLQIIIIGRRANGDNDNSKNAKEILHLVKLIASVVSYFSAAFESPATVNSYHFQERSSDLDLSALR